MKDHVISFLRVFGSAFIVSFAAGIASVGTVSWTLDFWTPLAIAAVSASFKLALNSYYSEEVNSVQK